MKPQHQTQVEVSLGKTLLGNWVEERKIAHIDSCPKSIKEVHIGGHDGILTQSDKKFAAQTTCKESYKKPTLTSNLNQGKRKMKMEQQLHSSISAAVDEQMNQPPPNIEFVSTTRKDYNREYTPIEKKPEREHNVRIEEPETFWKQNYNAIHGITKLPKGQAIFKKNTAFSTPIEETKDSMTPGEEWSY